jgi:4-amino-4-deoxy-L-arabinose transferase-like glycosyltransferase
MRSYRGLALGWLLVLTLLHLWMIASGRWPLSADEAHYWEWSRRLDWSYYSKGPMVAYLIAAGTRLGAATEFWVRLPAVLLGTATAAIAYVLARRTFPEDRPAFLSLVFLGVMPLYAVGAVLMTIDAPFVCCWGLAWLCLSRVKGQQGELAWYAAGVVFGLGLLAKYTMFMLVPCVALWLASSPRLRPWFRRQEPYLAAALGLLIFSPVIVWNARHGWYSMRHVLIQAGGGADRSIWAALLGGPEFFGSQVGVVSPLLFGLLVVGVVWAWREGIRRERDDLTLLVCASVPVFLFFQLWSFFSKVQANWAAHAYLTAVVAAAGWCQTWMRTGVGRRSRQHLHRYLLAAILLPAAFLSVAFVPELLEWTGFRIPPALDLVAKRLRGWPELGQAVGRAMARVPGPLFLVADHYQIASQLAFYVPGHPTVYNANFGRRMNQYDVWGGWEQLPGRDGVIVLQGIVAPPGDLREAFRTLEPLETVTVTDRGRRLREFTILWGREFRGFPARPFAGY